jgi:hypothetical protein
MPNQDGRGSPLKPTQLDSRAVSLGVIGRFCMTAAFLTLWMVRQPEHFTDGTYAGGMVGAAVVTGLLALLFGEPFRGPTLNRWDEMFGYLAIAALSQALTAD